MSGEGRGAGRKGGVVLRGQSEFNGALGECSAKNGRQGQAWRFGRNRRAGEMGERADRAIVVGNGRGFVAWGKRSGVGPARRVTQQNRGVSGQGCAAVEMHMTERHDELEGQRKQRQPGP
jgi:hypothetical protein